jgi:hypothetical protein
MKQLIFLTVTFCAFFEVRIESMYYLDCSWIRIFNKNPTSTSSGNRYYYLAIMCSNVYTIICRATSTTSVSLQQRVLPKHVHPGEIRRDTTDDHERYCDATSCILILNLLLL